MEAKLTELVLHLADDRLSVTLDCPTPSDDLDSLLADIQKEFKESGIASPIDRPALLETLTRARDEGRPLSGAVVLRGAPPVPPQDAVIEWMENFYDRGFVVDEVTGRVDYRRRMGQPSVIAGQLLAKLHPAREGRPGLDIYGKRIPVAVPKRLRLKAGTNVHDNEQDGIRHYYASCAGRVHWALEAISVDTIFTIAGNVGLETGEVRHNGAVTIQGDVLAESRIEAKGDIEILGAVEPADIVTEKNLHVALGITGAKGKKIIVGGSVHVKYLVNVELEAAGDVYVESEIIHSSIKTLGALHMPDGRLIGGTVMARGGIEVDEVGGKSCIATRLVVGADYRLAQELSSRNHEISQQTDNILKIQNALASMSATPRSLTSAQREAMTELSYQVSVLGENIKRLQQEKQDLEDAAQSHVKTQMTVKSKLYPESTIVMKDAKLTISGELDGPILASYENGHINLK